MTSYPAGTVAVATVRGVEGVRVMRNDVQWSSSRPIAGYVSHLDTDVTDVRPLVVLDLQDMPMHVSIAVHALREERTLTGAWIADQIEEQMKPPRMDQPAWGEKVTACTGVSPIRRDFVRSYVDTELRWVDRRGMYFAWDDLIDPEPMPLADNWRYHKGDEQ